MKVLRQAVDYLAAQDLADDTAPGAKYHGWQPVEVRYTRYPLFPPCSEDQDPAVEVVWERSVLD